MRNTVKPMPSSAKPPDSPEEALRAAVLELLRADQEYIRSYDAFLFGPRDAKSDRAAELSEAERRVDDARRRAFELESATRRGLGMD